jgi:hypothetical protein
VNFTADSQTLTGNFVADTISSLTIIQQNGSTLTGATISGDSITNITGNGHTVYYDADACPELNGQTYTLSEGGSLTPLTK